MTMGGTGRQSKGWLALLWVSLWLWAPSALAAECVLFEAPKADGADLKVYFTKFPQEDTSKGAYKGCRIVKKAEPGAKGFFITPFRQDATVVVHRSNWPGG
jgi:hypothetical protein